MKVHWRNIDYDLNLSNNYRCLSAFIHSAEAKGWPFQQRAEDFLEQIRIFSEVELSNYLPEKEIKRGIENLDYPLPISNRYFFNHLALQLTFFQNHRLKNLLDYHLKVYLELFPDKAETFLNSLDFLTCRTMEHNQITNYTERVSTILAWIREIRIKLDYPLQNITFNTQINTYQNNAVDVTNNTYNETTVIHAKSPKAKSKVSVKGEGLVTTLTDEQLKQLAEIVFNHTEGETDLQKVKIKVGRAVKGEPVTGKFILSVNELTAFCRQISLLTKPKQMFSKETKKHLAEWIVQYFNKGPIEKETPLKLAYVYKILRSKIR